MKLFIKYIAFGLLTTLVWMMLWHVVFMNGWEVTEKLSPKTWIWGDSQVFTGIVESDWVGSAALFSKAEHGNGYQDLLLFAERLPTESKVVIGFGPLFYRVNPDRNQGGFSLDGIEALWSDSEVNGGIKQFALNLKHNFESEFSVSAFSGNDHKYFYSKPNLKARRTYVDRVDSICLNSNCALKFEFKDYWLSKAMHIAHKKSSVLHIIALPVSKELSETSFSSVLAHYDAQLNSLSSRFNLPIHRLEVVFDEDPFYDATHLTYTAAQKVTQSISNYLENEPSQLLSIEYTFKDAR
jgi:hypothetical protein